MFFFKRRASGRFKAEFRNLRAFEFFIVFEIKLGVSKFKNYKLSLLINAIGMFKNIGKKPIFNVPLNIFSISENKKSNARRFLRSWALK